MKRTLAVLALLSTGCASAPERRLPTVEIQAPGSYTAAAVPAWSADLNRTDWWAAFEDTVLASLVREALAGNMDIRAAVARVDAAAAAARITRADQWPQLNAIARAQKSESKFIGLPFPGGDVVTVRSEQYGVSLDMSWEIDLWGRIRKGEEASLAELEASWADLAAVRTSIAAQTAKAYFALLEAERQVAFADTSVESVSRTVNQVRSRYEQGVRSSLDLRIALTTLANVEALRVRRLQQRDAAARQLEILMGRYPAAAVATRGAMPAVAGAVPGGLPSELLIRRPDLVAAERRYAASESRVSQSRRAFFPRLTLTGSAGTTSNELEDLVDLDFGVWSIAAGLAQPIFQGGRLRANLAQSHARADQSLAAYVQALLLAFGEVEQALTAETLLAERERHVAEAARQSRAAYRLAQREYEAGLADYISVLETQRSAIATSSELIAVQRERLDARINLHLALGGGFDIESEWNRFLLDMTSADGGTK
ncbi:MAG TPA: efflux transporter outer membrane subunit [Candidatus Krumholzibacteria bacterium]|nr:efflux transporter outer membrane subunit [Candidatus Krumholzibacteria bacterium]